MKKMQTLQEIRTIPMSKSISLRNFDVGDRVLITKITKVSTKENSELEEH